MNRRRCTFGSFVTMTLKCLAGAAIAFHFAAIPAYAVDGIQVYSADIAAPGTFTLQQHLNYVLSGNTTPDFPGGFASDRTLNGTPELAYGVTDWYELGLYAPFAFDNSGTFLPGGFKVRQLFVSPHAEDRSHLPPGWPATSAARYLARRRILFELQSDRQQHTLFGVVDFKVFGLDVNLGMGFGLTNASDSIVTKMIIGRAF
jgi:hypothetical protein